jgi:RIO kinase 1
MPESLTSLVDEGIIEEVLRPLMSGKEAQIYLVMANGRPCVAKIYKEAQNRTFKHRADYTEGRKVRNSRDQRAIDKRSKHGKGQDEAAWRSTEVDMIYRLQAAGVRVPAPYHFIDGVLVMELVTDGFGEPAPRLGEVDFTPEEASAIYDRLIREVVRMLCAGVVHGDLSDFNVLLGPDGPVIIDLPQAVDPSKNQNARKLLLRDVDNLHRFLSRFIPEARRLPYAEEMWALYESNQLTPESPLKGHYRPSRKKADTDAVLELISEANEDERRRRAAAQPQAGGRARRVEIIVDKGQLRTKAPGNPRPQTHAFANHAAKSAGLRARQAAQPRPHQNSANRAQDNQGHAHQSNARHGHAQRGPVPRTAAAAAPHPHAAAPASTPRRHRRPQPATHAAATERAVPPEGRNGHPARPQQPRPREPWPQQQAREPRARQLEPQQQPRQHARPPREHQPPPGARSAQRAPAQAAAQPAAHHADSSNAANSRPRRRRPRARHA